MKQISIFLVMMLTLGFADAQKLTDKDVPAPVMKAFTQKYSGAKGAKWEKEDDATLEAEFKMGKAKYSASFDQSGKWLETESEIKKSELPEAVRSVIAKEFNGFKVEKAERVETPDRGILYEVELEMKEIAYEVQFNEAGKVLKREIVEEDEEKEKD